MTTFDDKTYLLTKAGMLFNVTGYHHPEGHVYCSLKYVDGQKWTLGYEAAKSFLQREYPDYVDRYIQVPKAEISRVFSPRQRWRELIEAENPSPLHRQALDLADQLQTILQISSSDPSFDSAFAITDSLLWGDGHAASDIDLLVCGTENAVRVLEQGKRIYDHPEFSRPNPDVMKAPYGLDIPDWPELLARKMQMGVFRGRLFSLRAIKSQATQSNSADPNTLREAVECISPESEIDFLVADASHSLYFPATYFNAAGDELVDYSVVYEGVFRPGDRVRCVGSSEWVQCPHNYRTSFSATTDYMRYTITGPCQLTSP